MPDERATPELSIPWKVIAVSPDMMDVRYGNRTYPYIWRSSLAISVFEPRDNLPDGLCDQKIAFLKVTCSITGYQPLEGQGSGTEVRFPNLPIEQVTRLLTEYWGCYGVLLNVAVFPQGTPPELGNLPHILDFLPKNRELARPVTSTGEVLTASTSSLKLNSSLTTTEKNETQIGIKGGYAAGDAGGWNVEGNIQHTWGTTREARSETGIDSGGERRTTAGYSTSIDHLYTLLTGYHPGTNRAAFFLLPRPFTEQPTDRLSFAPGLRMIEGVQEFVLIVSRPSNMPGLCIEVSLDTGHFPTRVEYAEQAQELREQDRRRVEFSLVVFAAGSVVGGVGTQTVRLEDSPSATFRTPDGWRIDSEAAGQGVEEIEDTSTVVARNNLQAYQFRAVDSRTVRITGLLRGRDWVWDGEATLRKRYRAHLLREEVATAAPSRNISTTMLSTSRNLKVCYLSRDNCPEPPDETQIISPNIPAPLVRENNITIQYPGESERAILGGLTGDIMRKIQATLVTNASGSEYAPPPLLFTDTDYFKDNILKTLGKVQKHSALMTIPALPEKYKRIKSLEQLSANEVLGKNLTTLRTDTGLSTEDAIELRQFVLKFVVQASTK